MKYLFKQRIAFQIIAATLLISCANGNRNNKIASGSDAINVRKVSARQLRYLHYANGGLLGFYSDGSVVGCPRCDLVKENIDAMGTDTPTGRYTIASDGSLLINGSDKLDPAVQMIRGR